MHRSATLLLGLLLAFQPLQVSAQGTAFANSPDFQETDRQTPVIKDPAEYNAFMNALNDSDRARGALLWEEFLRAYPQSVMKIEVLEHLLSDYQQIAALQKAEGVADRILALDPDHLRALVVAAYAKRERASTLPDPKQVLALSQEARVAAEHGLTVLKSGKRPQDVSRVEWEKMRAQMAFVFYSVAGFGALQNKEYATARLYYLNSDLKELRNVFQLATAELEMTPENINGFWHAARAVNMARAEKNEAAARQIESYGKAKYRKYHGDVGGWDALLRASASAENPPYDFAVSRYQPSAPQPKPHPSPIFGDRASLGGHEGRDRDRDHDLDRNPRRDPCGAPAAALPRVERATPGGVPASVTSFGSDSRPHGVPASVTSPVNGQYHGVPASVTSIGTDCMLNGVAAGITSFSGDESRGVPASVTSPVDGKSHGIPASVTSIGVDGSLHGVPASIISPTPAPPVLRVLFGNPHGGAVAVVPVFGIRGIRTKKAEHRGSSIKNASLKPLSPRHSSSKSPSGASALRQEATPFRRE
ncbi:MAG: hypothetical protein LAP21_10930 [Acidobacteriia bacterium]|nr:hypothetical protein [Terriglobia bacterium]